MKFNVGILDRVIRFVLGAGIIAAGYYYQSWWGAIGLIPLISGAVGWCALYSLLNIDTGAKTAKNAENAEFL